MNSTKSIQTQCQREIAADKILIIHNNTPAMIIGNLLACLPMSFVLWGHTSSIVLISWVTAVYSLSVIRWLHHRAFIRANPTLDTQLSETPNKHTNEQLDNIKKLGYGYTVMALLSGCIWGSSAILFSDTNSDAGFTVLLLTLLSMTGGSMVSLSYRPWMYAAFALPALSPAAIIMFFHNQDYYHWLAVGLLFFAGFTFIFSRNLHRVINGSLILKYKNAELVLDLKKQTQTATAANKDKSRFIAAASHDLRQPLHAVNLFVESLKNKLTNNEQQHDLKRIHRGLDSLGELLNTLLNISQLDAGVTIINHCNFNIEEPLIKLRDQYIHDAKAKGISLSVNNCHYMVHSDPVLIEQILGNLVSNAIRYTETGSIELFCTNSSDNKIQVHVKDTGIGIANDDCENIFNEFFQLDNSERDRTKGLGLGLAIVRRTSELLKLPIHFNSTLGKGTEFILEISLGDTNTPSSAKNLKPAIENKLQELQVMVIDNEIDILDGMQNLLETWGCKTTCVESTELALEKINHGYQPQFILADYRMPGKLNGCQTVQEIRKVVTNVPALIITGDTGADVFAEIKSTQLMALNKPIKPAQLRVAITRLLSH